MLRTLVCWIGIHGLTACTTQSSGQDGSTEPPTSGSSTTVPNTTVANTTATNGSRPSSEDGAGGVSSQATQSQTPVSPTASDQASALPGETEQTSESIAVTESTSHVSEPATGMMTGEVSTGGSEPTKQTWVFTASSGGQLRAFEWDATAGVLNPKGQQAVDSRANEDVFIAIVPGSTQVFVATDKAIDVYDFDPSTGGFTAGAHGTTVGPGTYVSVSADLQHVYVAHYNDNALTYLTYKDGTFSAPQRFDSGQKAHSVQESKVGGWVLVPCLGSNHVAQYRREGDTLAAAVPPTVAVAGGPRHFAFHPSKPVAYVLTELTAELRAFEFGETQGLGSVLDTEVIGVQSGGNYWGSDVKVTPDGNDVFAVERNAKQVFHFDVEGDGTLQASGVNADLGGVVRAFDISSDGRHLFMGNNTGELRTFSFDSQSNQLTELPDAPQELGVVYTTLARDF